MRLLPSSVALFLGSATLALAQGTCPKPADLEGGIRLTRFDPFMSNVYTSVPGGLAEARVMVRDGEPEEVSTRYAHPLAVVERAGANGTLSLRYEADTAALDRLDQLGQWSTGVTLSINGAVVTEGVATFTYLGTETETIGGCSYETWRVHDRLTLARFPESQFEREYAPDLGLVLRAIRLNDDGSLAALVEMDEIRSE